MMDYRSIFAISASGMSVEKSRLDVTAANLANINSGRDAAGTLYQPLRLVSVPVRFAAGFEAARGQALPAGARVASIDKVEVAPRMVYEPGSPDADASGYVARPGVDHLGEMVNMTTALRAYQANVAAFNAAKTMTLKALELGGGR